MTLFQVTDLIPSGTTVNVTVGLPVPFRVLGVTGREESAWSSTGLRSLLPSASHQADLVQLLTPRTTYGRVTDTDRRSFAESLQRLQHRTQLDWGQIARTLGVSRRTVHNWLSGTRVNGVNAARLGYFYRAVIQELTGVNPEDSRAYLLTPDASGVTPLSRITAALRAEVPQIQPPRSAVDLLRPAETTDGPPITANLFSEIAPVELEGSTAEDT